jgi:hypothetical protein
VEDGPASFRIFLTAIFLALVWARGAAMLRFRLGVDFVELGWIRMMAFDGGGALFAEEDHGGN